MRFAKMQGAGNDFLLVNGFEYNLEEIVPKIKIYVIEDKMRNYCKEVGITMDRMDLLLWYLEAGEIFK